MKQKPHRVQLPDDSGHEVEQGFPICPLGLPQVGCACLGFYERGPGYLQLRFGALDNEGLCDVVVEEGAFQVAVRVVLCSKDDEHLGYRDLAEERTHVQLEEVLGNRLVIDIETGRAVPFYVPTYLDNRLTCAPGYYNDEDEAIAAAELQPELGAQPVARRGGLPLRTCGF
jgi:hypothetical protein